MKEGGVRILGAGRGRGREEIARRTEPQLFLGVWNKRHTESWKAQCPVPEGSSSGAALRNLDISLQAVGDHQRVQNKQMT